MQLTRSLNINNTNLEKIINKILYNGITNKYIETSSNNSLKIATSIIVTFLYLHYLTQNYNVKNRRQLNILLNNLKSKSNNKREKPLIVDICKKIDCLSNKKIFSTKISISDYDNVEILAKPDAFCGEFPVEIKNISSITYKYNRDLVNFIEEYGKYQAAIYGFVLGKNQSYLIISIYEFNGEIPKIKHFKVISVRVNPIEIGKKIEDILKNIIIPRLYHLYNLNAAGGI